MSNATNNNGHEPFTQQTRDNMAQTDHDTLTKLGVLMETVLNKILSIEQQIKDATVNQAAALAAWEVKSQAAHDAFDVRVRKLEDVSNKYIPDYITKVDEHTTAIEALKTSKAEILAGWKGITLLIASIGGLLGGIYTIINIINFLTHICTVSCGK